MRRLIGLFLSWLLLTGFSPLAIEQQHPSIRLVQTQSVQGPGTSTGTQTCTWNFGKAIAPGDTVIGFIHSTNNTDAVGSPPMTPDSITDNASPSNTYHLVTATTWYPWPEDIQAYWLTNIQGRPTSFTYDFTSYPNSGSTIIGSGSCNVGFSEFSGVGSILISGPVDITNTTAPSISITSQANSLLWVFGTIDNGTAQGIGFAAGLPNAGYSGIIDNWSQDDLGVWLGKFPIPFNNTLTFSNPLGQTATCATSHLCDASLFIAALQPSAQIPLPTYGTSVISPVAGGCGTADPGGTTCVFTTPTLTSGDTVYFGTYACPGNGTGCTAAAPSASSITGTGLSCANVKGPETDGTQHITIELWKCSNTTNGTVSATITWPSNVDFSRGWALNVHGLIKGDLGIGNTSTALTADANDASGQSFTLSASGTNSWTNALTLSYFIANGAYLSTKGANVIINDSTNTGIVVTAGPAAFGTPSSGIQTANTPTSGIMTVLR